jgi:hypothetical protein
MNECRQGSRFPVDGRILKNAKVEIGVEIGLIMDVEAACTKGDFDMDDVKVQVKEKVSDIFHTDNQDKVLNNICIYNIQ